MKQVYDEGRLATPPSAIKKLIVAVTQDTVHYIPGLWAIQQPLCRFSASGGSAGPYNGVL